MQLEPTTSAASSCASSVRVQSHRQDHQQEARQDGTCHPCDGDGGGAHVAAKRRRRADVVERAGRGAGPAHAEVAENEGCPRRESFEGLDLLPFVASTSEIASAGRNLWLAVWTSHAAPLSNGGTWASQNPV